MLYTTNYRLNQLEGTDPIDVSILNANMDVIDKRINDFKTRLDNLTPKETSNVSVTGITLYGNDFTMNKGSTKTLTAKVSPKNATNKNVTWSSSDTNIATVSNGKVTAVKAGTATITATAADGGYSASCTVTIGVPVTGITLNKSSISMLKEGTKALAVTVFPEDATNKKVVWSSSDTATAVVSSTGKVTAVKAGTATITATAADGGYSASCTVTIGVLVTGITLNKSSISINKDETETLTATIAPTDATNKNVTWSSSDTTIATVSNGKITAVKAGMATITATAVDGGYSASCTVMIDMSVTGITLDKEILTLFIKDKTATLTATVLPDIAYNKNVTWSSSDTSIATVDSSGVITAKNEGIVTITATTEDGNYSASCSVGVVKTNSVTDISLYYAEGGTLVTITPKDFFLFENRGISEITFYASVTPSKWRPYCKFTFKDTGYTNYSNFKVIDNGDGSCTVKLLEYWMNDFYLTCTTDLGGSITINVGDTV